MELTNGNYESPKGIDDAYLAGREIKLLDTEQTDSVIEELKVLEQASAQMDSPEQRQKRYKDFTQLIVDKFDISWVYEPFLNHLRDTHETLSCNDPFNEKNQDCFVSTGKGDWPRGTFYNPVTKETLSVFDFLIEMKTVTWLGEAYQWLADKMGIDIPDEEYVSDMDRDVENLNQTFAVSQHGNGRTTILQEVYDPILKKHKTSYITEKDFRLLLKNKSRIIGENYIELSMAWLTSPLRRQYKMIMFDPSEQLGARYYNLWKGFTVSPRAGDCSLFLNHINDVICSKNAEHFNYLVKWMASIIQKPGIRTEICVALIGEQGTGKGIFVEHFGHLFGQHYFHLSQSSHLTGHFNSHLQDKILLFADEAFWAGDKQGKNILKALITEKDICIEPKGQTVYSAKNFLNLIMASNENWVVPAEADERRYFVLRISNLRKKDHVYFTDLNNQMKSGGYEALLAHLQGIDLQNFNVRDYPATEELLNQKLQSLDPVGQFWYELLETGANDNLKIQWETQIKTTDIFDQFQTWCRTHAYKRPPAKHIFGKTLKKYCNLLENKGIGATRTPHYVFPDVDTCRSLFQKHLGCDIEWSTPSIRNGICSLLDYV